jgi:hypothetical protein
MAQPKFRVLGSSTTTPIDNKYRKQVLITPPEIYSQQVDLSDLIGMDPDDKKAIQSIPYEIRDKGGRTLLKDKTDEAGDTQRVFTTNKAELILYVGDSGWSLSMDSLHEP